MISKRLGLILLTGLLPGCATITRGSSQSFVVETQPPSADVEFSTGLRCKSPCSLKVKRKDGFVVKITKDGYRPVEANITSQMSGGGGTALAGNVFLGGLIGAGIDAGTGATKELKPNPLVVVLERDEKAQSTPATASSGSTVNAGSLPNPKLP